MSGTIKGIVLPRVLFLCGLLATTAFGNAHAEQSHLIYPSGIAVFHYDPDRFEIIGPGHANYVANFSIGNQMLWDRVDKRIPIEVYRAPNLIGFEVSANGRNEFVTMDNEFNIVIDGFGTQPRTLGNIYLRFIPEPHQSYPLIELAGELRSSLVCPVPPLDVVTPIEDGYYADTRTQHLRWSGAVVMRIIAFSDKNGNGVYDGEPTYSIRVQDGTIPVQNKSWGAIKAQYRDQ